MRLETLRVELRPRSPWEAVELGTALVRANARAIWRPWLLVTVPVFVAINAAAWALDAVWAAWLVMWWLKPLFDRIPLFVLSRSVFGDTPSVRQTLAAQRSWGWRAMAHALTWRRISLSRALTLPVDLLEGAEPNRLRERRRVLGDAVRGHVVLLTLMCVGFIVVLSLSTVALGLLFVPSELLMSESMRALWTLVQSDPPPWAQIVLHAAVWAATSVVEPFYIGAGFGLYLNRRTQIEAWDVEIAFRRIRARLAGGVAAIVLALGLASGPIGAGLLAAAVPMPAQAGAARLQDDESAQSPRAAAQPQSEDDADVTPLADVFGDDGVDDAGFRKAVDRAYADPLLRPKRTESIWKKRHPDKDAPSSEATPFPEFANLFSFVTEFGLWLLLAGLLAVLALTAKRWWPWLRGVAAGVPEPTPVEINDASLPDVLPDDIAAAARALWREGRPRRALALLYRASVDAMAQRAEVTLVPGATESECLRASRRMPEADDRDAFARVVRMWQYAAYAQRLPDGDGFEALLGTLSQRFGWRAA